MACVTDDEKRRVARNIRENYIRAGMGYMTANAYNIALAVGIVPEILAEDIALWNRLADLIEPDKGRSADIGKTCDREALLALAEEMEEGAMPDGGDFGSGIDAALMGAVSRWVADCASRIREACGVER